MILLSHYCLQCIFYFLQGLKDAHTQFIGSLSQARADYKQLAALDRQIKSYNVTTNPYVCLSMLSGCCCSDSYVVDTPGLPW